MRKISLILFYYFLLSLACLNPVYSQGQNVDSSDFGKLVDFLPPAPNAASIIKYGGIKVNQNTGAPNISIPITNVSLRKLSTGISLGYSSTGIKVDEVASRVGMGWTILAGGVITRIMRGKPDELNIRHVPYAEVGTNVSTYNFMYRIVNTYSPTGYDSEPDLFSFNFDGFSGSFVFDDNMQVVPIIPSKFKFEYQFTSSYWNFKITTPDGVSYYFGGDNATETTKREQLCGKSYETYIPTAWYLTKIEQPNGDAIFFHYTPWEYTYDNGVSETMYWTLIAQLEGGSGGGDCATKFATAIPNTSCINISRTQGVLLDEIRAPGNQLIKFDYTTREDCADKLISKMTQTNLATGSVGVTNIWNFLYKTDTSANYNGKSYNGINKTPYLIGLIQRNADSSLLLQHTFVYNDPLGRPPRLSYAQDHWGYFNGKNNTTLIPLLDQSDDKIKFKYATANREPDFKYAVKGMLSKIMYPTGGFDSLVYESNEVMENLPTGNNHELFSRVTGTATSGEKSDTSSFVVNTNQNIPIVINCIDNSGTGSFDSVHNFGTLQILNPSGQVVYSQTKVTPGTNILDSFRTITTGRYSVTVKAMGTVVTTKVTINFIPNIGTTTNSVSIGGIRVKSIFTSPNKDEKPIVKRYYYGRINSLNNSSLIGIPHPIYKKVFDTRVSCVPGVPSADGVYHHIAMYSNSIVTLLNFQSALISYGTVVESNGDSLAGGASETNFNALSDAPGYILWGDGVVGAPYSNASSLLNSKVKDETIYKLDNTNTLVPINKKINTYKLDTRKTKWVYGYSINQKYVNSATLDSTNCALVLSSFLSSFDMTRYDYLSKWIYQDSSTDITYDQNGLNPVSQVSVYYYDDSVNLQLSKTDTYDSKGNLKRSVFKYPNDYTNIDVYNDMQSKNISSPVIDVQTFTNSIKNVEINTNYKKWSNSNYLPDSIYKGTLANPLEIEGAITKYDKAGNILEFKGRNGVLTSIIYGYNNLFPVAKIVGASYNQAKNKLSVDTAVINVYGSEELIPELNNIRTGLPNAFVTTYTYQNLVGVTSITDENSKTTSFDYDGLNRLKTVRDFENNYLKKLDYSYNQPDPTQSVKAWFNPLMSQTFYCQACLTNYYAVPYVYSIPAGKYFSTVSQADANSKAQRELVANGQNTANANGTCTKKCTNCVGEDKKCINDLCETGVKVVDVIGQDPLGGLWTCWYHWLWSDGSKIYYTTTDLDYCEF